MTQKERREVTDKIMSWCERTPGVWALKVHADAAQGTGIPDIIGCDKGTFWACEAKRPGEKPTRIQRHTLEKIQRSGGLAFVAHSLEEFLEALGREEDDAEGGIQE